MMLTADWSDLPRDILQAVTGHLCWIDRFRVGAVCKAWSVPIPHAPSIQQLPWAFKYRSRSLYRGVRCKFGGQLIDPRSREYAVNGKELWDILGLDYVRLIPYASVYGWVLFQTYARPWSFFMYSPFTNEIIMLPPLTKSPFGRRMAVTFSLTGTSPKCVVILLWKEGGKLVVNLCSPGDDSWKTIRFNDDFVEVGSGVLDATYSDGFFYCVFYGGGLGAFNVEREEWTILANPTLPREEHNFSRAKLVSSDNGDLRLLLLSSWSLVNSSEYLELFKFDFSEKRWVNENDNYLNNHVLFMGCTSFSIPAVGKASQLRKTVFSSLCQHYPGLLRFYGNKSRTRRSPLYLNCVEETEGRGIDAMVWIEVPSGGIWRADELIHGVGSNNAKQWDHHHQ